MSQRTLEHAVREFLASNIPTDSKSEFVRMIQLVQECRGDAVKFAEELLGVPLNDFQRKFLRITTSPRSTWWERFQIKLEEVAGLTFGINIAFPANQVGKTVMIAIKHIWFNFYKIGLDLDGAMMDKAGYQTLNISPHSRQVKQAFQYIKDILNQQFIIEENGKKRLNKLSPMLQNFLLGENANLGEIRFINKSTMYSVPVGQDQAASLAGGQFGYISYDECAQSLHLEAELGAKILSRLIKYGMGLDLISTAEVDSVSHQYYFHIVKLGLQGREGWWAMGAKLDDNKFISVEQRDRIKATLLKANKIKYRQVVHGEFVSGGKRFFDPNEIENMFKLPGRSSCQAGHKYLVIADWGMADLGDPSVFFVLDYTNFPMGGKIRIVHHDEIQGGSPFMQFAMLRTVIEQYTWEAEDGMSVVKPYFIMDANALGGVVIKKMLVSLNPHGFEIEKDIALAFLKAAVSDGRDYVESEIDGAIIEKNPEFGVIESYYIEKLSDQMGVYHLDDKKLTQDYVMTLTMGVSYLWKKYPRKAQKGAVITPLAGYNATVTGQGRQIRVRNMNVEHRSIGIK